MRYPLPYAFARSQQVLLEDDAQGLTLHVQPLSLPSGIAEALRKYPVHQVQNQRGLCAGRVQRGGGGQRSGRRGGSEPHDARPAGH